MPEDFILKPFDAWGCNPLINHALEAVDPRRLVQNNTRLENNRLYIKDQSFDLSRVEKFHIIGAGKAAPFLWEGLKDVMGARISGGIIVSLESHAFTDDKVAFFPGGHPVPNMNSIDAGYAVARYCRSCVGKNDLVFLLVSGGASAMMALPVPGIDLNDKIEINKLLLNSGAEVTDTNCVRKQLSALKGGKLAKMIFPAKVITLILSDIVDSPLNAVGSGPSMPDSSSISDALAVLHKYHIFEKLSPKLQAFFLHPYEEKNCPPPFDFSGNTPFLIGDNHVALEAAAFFSRKSGVDTHIITSSDKGEAREAAKIYASIIKEIISSGNPFKPPTLLLSGGELTVTIDKPGEHIGKGGRNHTFILQILKELAGISSPFYIASFGSDGIDGSSDAAGAWIDHLSFSKCKSLNLDPDSFLANYDSHSFFEKMNQQIKTGPTHTNVMDLRLFYLLS